MQYKNIHPSCERHAHGTPRQGRAPITSHVPMPANGHRHRQPCKGSQAPAMLRAAFLLSGGRWGQLRSLITCVGRLT